MAAGTGGSNTDTHTHTHREMPMGHLSRGCCYHEVAQGEGGGRRGGESLGEQVRVLYPSGWNRWMHFFFGNVSLLLFFFNVFT